MDPSQLTTGITFASMLTPTGVIAAAALVTAVIALIKNTFAASLPAVANISGALLAFVFTAILYVLAALATGVGSLDAGLVVFMAWLSCATSAVGIHSTVRHTNEVRKRSS